MNTISLTLIVLAQVALVAGQLFLKHGMNQTRVAHAKISGVAWNLLAGVAMLTLWFLLWMGLLQKLDLSFVYPFEGISPVLLVLAAWVILREKLSLRTWLGVIVIAVGTALVGVS